MPFIPSGIPAALGGSTSATYTPAGVAYDVAIAGIPFFSAISADSPYIRESADKTKQQFDTGDKAGERSLGDWWRRSGASWHGGAGLLYAEPDGPANPVNDVRFYRSFNADVWTPGQVTRLPDNTQVLTIGSAITGLVTASSGGTNYTLASFGTTLRVWNGASFTDYTWGGTNTILSLTTDGQNYWVCDNTGIYSGPVDGSIAGTKKYNQTAVVSTRVKLAWVKQRLMAGMNAAVYELVAAGLALPAAKYTHPNSSWTWTDFADGPAAILASGYVGLDSAIHEFTLATDGQSPTLVAGQATPLPPGEVCYALKASSNSFLGIGTSRGLRVGQFDLNATLVLGALTVETPQPVKAITARSSYLYAAATAFTSGESHLIRVDLGQPTDNAGRYAYAADLVAPAAQTTTCSQAAIDGTNRVVFALDSYGIVREGSGPGSTRPCWLETARIRFATVEPKLYRLLWLRGSFASPGTIGVTVTSSDGQVTTALPPVSSSHDIDEIAVVTAPQEWVSIKFAMDSGSGIVFRGYVLKAMPGGKPRRLFQIPVMCYDNEEDRYGVMTGYPGYGMARLLQLEDVEDAQDVVLYEIFTPQGTLSRQVTIDRLSYRQVNQPGQTGTVGGVIIATLKTVT